MGNYRGIGQEQNPSEVFGRLSNNLDTKELFEVWKAYNDLRINGLSAKEAVRFLYGEDLSYFTSVGLELFNKKYIENEQ